MRLTRRTAALFTIAAAVAVPIAGCGSSKNDSSSTTATQAASTSGGGATSGGSGSTVNLTATEYKFTPSDGTVKSGKVTFNEMNMGHTTHSLEIEDVTPGHDQKLEGSVTPGQNGTLAVNLKPGKYTFYCPIDNHRQMGMEGTITVK